MPPRRFPPPWTIEDIGAAFVVSDSAGQQLAYIYYEDEPEDRETARKLVELIGLIVGSGGRTEPTTSALKSQIYGPARCSVRLSYARFFSNAGDFPSQWEAADKHHHRFPRYPLIIRWTPSRRAPTNTVRPNEESRSGGLADFKWSSLRI